MKKARVVPRPALIAVSLLILLMLAMFADVLFAGGTRVLGNQTTDLYLQFVSWRDFGFFLRGINRKDRFRVGSSSAMPREHEV